MGGYQIVTSSRHGTGADEAFDGGLDRHPLAVYVCIQMHTIANVHRTSEDT